MLKNTLLFSFALGFLLLTAASARAAPKNTETIRYPVTYAAVNNHYGITLPGGDRGSIYMTRDHTMTFIPALTNEEYVHNCWGLWNFMEAEQTLKISKADKCRFMNGTYAVSKQNQRLYLKEGPKTLILYPFVNRESYR